MNNLCSICMRGGSKGVVNKNLKKLNGKPLMAYTIEQAIASKLFKHVIVSTDSEEIYENAKFFGADAWFLRPKYLSTDEAAKLPVIQHAFMEAEKHYGIKFDSLTDLDATSPLRTVQDIINAYNQFTNEKAKNLISGCASRKNPYFNMVEKVGKTIKLIKEPKFLSQRRQDAPKVYDMNASIYIWKRESILNSNSLFTKNTSLYVMPEERSIDIDTDLDWKFVQFLKAN
jgi:CMP-N,N'-diacetyllegionaminic acid synthase